MSAHQSLTEAYFAAASRARRGEPVDLAFAARVLLWLWDQPGPRYERLRARAAEAVGEACIRRLASGMPSGRVILFDEAPPHRTPASIRTPPRDA